ncbi:uncharacterized protein LOC144125381 [Amblyomma americanum]
MGACWSYLKLTDKPSIQTMASASFTVNTIALMTCLFAIIKSDDAAVYLKLQAIDSAPGEIFVVSITGIVVTYTSILTDLFLLVGIEDNCRLAMQLFTWWSSFCISLKGLLVLCAVAWKVTAENLILFVRVVLLTTAILVIKGHYTRQVHAYYQQVKPLNTAQPTPSAKVVASSTTQQQQQQDASLLPESQQGASID